MLYFWEVRQPTAVEIIKAAEKQEKRKQTKEEQNTTIEAVCDGAP